MVVHTLVYVLAPASDLVTGVATTTDAYIFISRIVLHTLLSCGTGLGRATTRRLYCYAAFTCWVTFKARGTLTSESTWFIATHSSWTTWVVGTLINVCTSKHTDWVTIISLTADAFRLSINQLAVSIRATTYIFTRVCKKSDSR